MSDRITGLIVVVLALAYFASATTLDEPFFADPLGPRAFPILVAFVAAVCGVIMLLKPDTEPEWPKLTTFYHLMFAVIALVLYAFALKPLGFLASTALAGIAVSYLIEANARNAVMAGVALSGGLFLIFKFIFGLSLFALPRWLMG
jgi:putative tricarboxylic transport membrane protein